VLAAVLSSPGTFTKPPVSRTAKQARTPAAPKREPGAEQATTPAPLAAALIERLSLLPEARPQTQNGDAPANATALSDAVPVPLPAPLPAGAATLPGAVDPASQTAAASPTSVAVPGGPEADAADS